MKVQIENPDSRYFIKHYQPGKVTLNKHVFTNSVIITADDIINNNWLINTVNELDKESAQTLLALDSEVILLGTGSKLIVPDQDFLAIFYAAGKGVDFMDNHAACRTFNIIADEGRKVALALLIESKI